jgi:predicted ATPase
MKIPVEISINYLWGDIPFRKEEWGDLNYLIGSNGSGKSQFIEKLIPILNYNKLKTRYLNSDRLASWIKQQHAFFINPQMTSGLNVDLFSDLKQNSRIRGEVNEAFVLLRDNLNIRIKVESIISQLLNRTVLFEERAGYIIPKVAKGRNQPYSFKENESHGLKMLITMLTLLHDDSYNCLIIDEPELHLHPQFQTFFLQEIRKYAGNPITNPRKKCFFFATHSPHFIDVRTIEELKHCIIFQPDKLPSYISTLDTNDEYRLKQLLPRLNTHHKQFFFSPRPIFVEGSTDQQIFALIQERRGKFIGSSGAGFIDVNGKDELDLYFRLCRQLTIDCQIIADLDVLNKGLLRDTVSKDQRCKSYLQERGVSMEFVKAWGEISQKTDNCIEEFLTVYPTSQYRSEPMTQLYDAISSMDKSDERRYLFIQAIQTRKPELLQIIGSKKEEITLISGRISISIEAFRTAGVYVLPEGQLENYLKVQNAFNISDKDKTNCFSRERDFLLQNTPTEQGLRDRYGSLIDILDSVTRSSLVDYKPLLRRHIIDFIYGVQVAYLYKEITDDTSLRAHKINLAYSNVIELVSFTCSESSFSCKIKIVGFEDLKVTEYEFNEKSNPTVFDLSGKIISK